MIDLTKIPKFAFLRSLESNLSRLSSNRKMSLHFLECAKLRLEADAVWFFQVSDRCQKKMVLIKGSEELYDGNLLMDFLALKRPDIPRNTLLAFIKVHGRIHGAIGAAVAEGEFELGMGRVLKKLCTLFGHILTERDEARLSGVLDRIREKIIGELRPRDLAYQILDGIHQLVHYDHSSAFLTYDEKHDVFRVAAEKIVWTKAKSGFVGHEMAMLPQDLETLRQMKPAQAFSVHEVEGEPESHKGIYHLLDYHRGEGVPEVTSILFAPLFFEEELLGILKIAGSHRPPFDDWDQEVVARFLPAARIALRNAKVKVNLENRAMEAELQAGLVTLARAVAHDVNNAIGAALPLAKQMREDLRNNLLDAAVLERDLDVIIDKVTLCKRIFSNMLLSGVERSGSGPVDVNQVIREVLPILQAQVGERRIRIQLALEEQLPVILSSKQHLERIIWNLATNAIEAIGRRTGHIIIATQPLEEDGVRVSVKDNGPGIPPENLKQVQEPFFSTKRGGTGLGLSICRSLAWQHGGGLKILPVVPHGTEILVELGPARSVLSDGDPIRSLPYE